MSWLVRGIVVFLVALAAFWLLAMVVGWLGYLLMGAGVVAFVGFLVWLCSRPEKTLTRAKPPRGVEKKAAKELDQLERRLKNPPQN